MDCASTWSCVYPEECNLSIKKLVELSGMNNSTFVIYKMIKMLFILVNKARALPFL